MYIHYIEELLSDEIVLVQILKHKVIWLAWSIVSDL